MTLYERIDLLLSERHETRKKMCEEAKIPYDTLNSMIKRNSASVDMETLGKLAGHFKCSTDFLLGRTNAQKPENQTLSDTLGLSDKSIANIQLCNERGWATDDFIAHTYFKPLILNFTAYKNIDDIDYLDKKLGRTFADGATDKQRKLYIRAEIDDCVSEIIEEK